MRLDVYDDISSWAMGDVMYLTGYGVMKTKNGSVEAKAFSLREEIAYILHNVIKSMYGGEK